MMLLVVADNGTLTFRFTVTYSNGTVKIYDVPVTMIIPDKDKFAGSIANLDEVTKRILLSLYDHLAGHRQLDDPQAAVEAALKRLFPPGYLTDEIMVPYSFHFTPLGQVLFGVMHGNNAGKLYTVNELIELTKTDERPKGYSKQYIYLELRDKDGCFYGRAIYKGAWYIPEVVVMEFLKLKGIKRPEQNS
jgi:hypothetical protein